MTYEESISYIHSVSWRGSLPGLSRIRELCRRLGDPQDSLRFIHVAGTNGKGSFCTMLESVLRRAGYRTGLFTSPFVLSFCERMRVCGRDIEKDEFAAVTELVRECADGMDDPPTEFELITAIAFEFFKRYGCELVVLEVGMGGRLDSTNIIKPPVLSVITEISLDHTSQLGSTVEAIAGEKAGIIKDGSPVLFTGTDPRAGSVIKEAARAHGSRYYEPDYGSLRVLGSSVEGNRFAYKGREYETRLAGVYQPKNAASVACAADILASLGYEIANDAVCAGLYDAVWHARFELLCRDPVIIYDGGHNPQGVTAAFDSMGTYFPGVGITALSGVMADKDYDRAARIAAEHGTLRVYTVRPDNPRALSAEAYADTFRRHGVEAIPCANVADGVRAAVADAKANGRPLLIFGSLYLYAEASAAVFETVGREK